MYFFRFPLKPKRRMIVQKIWTGYKKYYQKQFDLQNLNTLPKKNEKVEATKFVIHL